MKKSDSNSFYGKTPDSPVLLNSIELSMRYLNNLVTEDGLHIVYHRVGSLFGDKPIDRYEILSSDLKYDDIYISIYSETVSLIPPDGYLFERDSINIEFDDGEEEYYEIDEIYLYGDKLDVSNTESLLNATKNLPPLERILFDSGGINFNDPEFPYGVITYLVENEGICPLEKLTKVLAVIKPR